MLKVSAVMILSKPCLNDLACDIQAVIFGPCSRVGLKVQVRLSLFFFFKLKFTVLSKDVSVLTLRLAT